MQGELLWFNQTKDEGRIRTDDGENLVVQGGGFEPGHVPTGRCAGTRVSFERTDVVGGDAHALDVSVITEPLANRARRRAAGNYLRR